MQIIRILRQSLWRCRAVICVALGVSIAPIAAYGQDQQTTLPFALHGTWEIVGEYETRNVTALDQVEVRRLIGSLLTFSEGSLASCGQSIAISSIQVRALTGKEFFSGVYVNFSEVHISSTSVDEVLVDGDSAGDCRGSRTLPGEHVYIKSKNELLIQYEGGFFRAVKSKKSAGGAPVKSHD
jgi:hypothetical protein